MSYSKLDHIPVSDEETAVRLDSGEIVAVKCTRSVAGGRMDFSGTARVLNQNGTEFISATGQAIVREFQHSDPRAELANEIGKDVLLALLGERPLTVTWSAQVLQDVSIRQAIALTNISSGALNAADVL